MKTHNGDLIIDKDTEIDFQQISGNLIVRGGVKLIAPKLETVGGHLDIYSLASLEAPKLETVGGHLGIHSQASLPKLETVGGHLYISSQASLPKLETVGGHLGIHSQASLPKLETVGGYLYIYSQASLPKLETVGGHLGIHSQASLEAPKLEKGSNKEAEEICKKSLALSFKKKGLIKADGILSWLISKKKIKDIFVFKIKVVGRLKVSFMVQRGESFSHGETVAEAIDSLKYKLADRDTTRFKKWTLTKKITQEEAIQAYRAITGACEYGVRSFVESKKIPASLTVKKVIELTKDQYGHAQFSGFAWRDK